MKKIGYAVIFFILSAISTIIIWAIMSLMTPEPLSFKSMKFRHFIVGGIGPIHWTGRTIFIGF